MYASQKCAGRLVEYDAWNAKGDESKANESDDETTRYQCEKY